MSPRKLRTRIIRTWMAIFLLFGLGMLNDVTAIGWASSIPIAFLFSNCCCSTCTIFSDAWGSDDTATSYTKTGTWSVSGSVATATTSNALLVTNSATNSGATGAQLTVASFGVGSTSDKLRLYLAWVDSTHYWVAEFQAGASNGTVKLFENTGSGEVQRSITVTITGWTTSRAIIPCISIGGGIVGVTATITIGLSTNTYGITYSSSPSMGSTKAAIGTATITSSATFGAVSFNKHKVDDATCSKCSGYGCGHCTTTQPDQLQVVTTGAHGFNACCANQNGTWVVTRSADGIGCNQGFTGQCVWNYTASSMGICDFGGPGCVSVRMNATAGGQTIAEVGDSQAPGISGGSQSNWKSTESSLDCTSLSSYSLAGNATSNLCNPPNAPATITTL